MSKYYVQCGPIQTVLVADSAEQAALAALDLAFQNHLWIYDDPGLTEQECRDHMMLEALFYLDPTVRISERGFDRGDALMVGTPEIVARWHGLMEGMSRLFIAAGLAPRSMATVAGVSDSNIVAAPRLPR